MFESDFEQFLRVLYRRFSRLPGLHMGGNLGLVRRQRGNVVALHHRFGPITDGGWDWLFAARLCCVRSRDPWPSSFGKLARYQHINPIRASADVIINPGKFNSQLLRTEAGRSQNTKPTGFRNLHHHIPAVAESEDRGRDIEHLRNSGAHLSLLEVTICYINGRADRQVAASSTLVFLDDSWRNRKGTARRALTTPHL